MARLVGARSQSAAFALSEAGAEVPASVVVGGSIPTGAQKSPSGEDANSRSPVADPFCVVGLANDALDEVRRRIQQQTLGHRGHKEDPLHRARDLLTMASERVTGAGRARLRGLLDAGDPYGEVRDARRR